MVDCLAVVRILHFDASNKHHFRSSSFIDTSRLLWSTGEMALLVEGLGVGGDTSIEEYIIGPADELADNQEQSTEKDQINLLAYNNLLIRSNKLESLAKR